MSMHFDIVFLDTTANKFYDRITLEKEPLGGTEASIVRIAEGLGSLGLKVAVVQARVDSYFAPIMGQHAFFMHADDAQNMSCRHYIQLRKNSNPHIFKGAKKYLWMHDVAYEEDKDWVPSLIEHDVKVIGVSRWHKNNIMETLSYGKVDYIYNPVPDEIYADPNNGSNYDPKLMVWAASPHKGIGKAIEIFRKIHAKDPKMQLAIFNPGYLELDISKTATVPGLITYGPMNCKTVWNIMRKSLCVFYPTHYNETFGCIASEANAMGVPLLTHRKAGLGESVSSDLQFVDENEDDIVNKALKWSNDGRPKVAGKDEFKLSEVLVDWVKLLAR